MTKLYYAVSFLFLSFLAIVLLVLGLSTIDFGAIALSLIVGFFALGNWILFNE